MSRWELAMSYNSSSFSLLGSERQKSIKGILADTGEMRAPGIAQLCFKRASCFNNYRLVEAVMQLELLRSGLEGERSDALLRRPNALRVQTERVLNRLQDTTSLTASVRMPRIGARQAAILSDPSRYPLAYQVLCTALAVRALELGGNNSSYKMPLKEFTHKALWGLAGIQAPNGELSWMGRGQDQVWIYGASTYAALAGAELYAKTDPSLSARLRRVADLSLNALEDREGKYGFSQVPGGDRSAHRGIDHYASVTGNAWYTLAWLEMARPHAKEGTVRPVPSQQEGGRFYDPQSSKLATVRKGKVWMGIHLQRDHLSDERNGFGLVRGMRKASDGSWRELRAARPIPEGGRATPHSGPSFQAGGSVYRPIAKTAHRFKDGIVLRGVWRGKRGALPARWVWRVEDTRVTLEVKCPRAGSLSMIEWYPKGTVRKRGNSLNGRHHFLSWSGMRESVVKLQQTAASARDGELVGYQIRWNCRAGQTVKIRWTGDSIARP
jgi:hypothetical protein